jgi:hypothetical protein
MFHSCDSAKCSRSVAFFAEIVARNGLTRALEKWGGWRRRGTTKQLLFDDPKPIPSQAVTQPIDQAIVTTTEASPEMQSAIRMS